MGEAQVRIEFYDHIQVGAQTLHWLETAAGRAIPLCLASPGTCPPDLPSVAEVEVSLVDDETIARIHDEYLDDPTPTDVITFPHGEIFIGAETAAREGPEHGHSAAEEMLLYVVHGLLHLNGHIDTASAEREAMHAVQDRIVAEIVRDHPAPGAENPKSLS